ncbi:MAG: cyclic pyranopterin monophosphate synthase MoaC [Candidatus Eisenbacteria bacterium]
MDERRLSHVGEEGGARMVDVSAKGETLRTARAEAVVRIGPETARLVAERGGTGKGNVLETARLAAILGAKRTADLVPLCHPLPIDHIDVDARLEDETVRLTATVTGRARTGLEMEAMTAAAVGALTVYDMCKSAEKGITIESVRLLEKRGGKSGDWKRREEGGDR